MNTKLEALAARCNALTGSPREPHDGNRWNVGHYLISCSYGGYALQRVYNEAGAIRDIFGSGNVPARDLTKRLEAYVRDLNP